MGKLILSSLFLIMVGCKFAEVDAGKYYRGPQPSGAEIDEAVAKYGVKTIINLRGKAPGSAWYEEEKAAIERNGLTWINIGMGATRLPHREDLIKLLDAFRDAPRPLYVHCQAGVDRTGEASAIYQMLYMGKSREEAMKMLPPSQMKSKYYFIEELWRGEEWARSEYNPCAGEYKYYDVNNDYCKKGVTPPVEEGDDT